MLAGTAVLTVGMALMAGVLALRSVRQIEPMSCCGSWFGIAATASGSGMHDLRVTTSQCPVPTMPADAVRPPRGQAREDLRRRHGPAGRPARVSIDLYPGQLALLMGPSGSREVDAAGGALGAARTGHRAGARRRRRPAPRRLGDDRRASGRQYRLRHTGFVFQGYNLFPALTARQQLEIVLKWGERAGGGEARRRADEMLDTARAAEEQAQEAGAASGGEKQRVAIGRALVKNPTFVFADEPTSALDWENGQKVIELLRDAAHERRRVDPGRVARPPHPAVRGRVLPPGRRRTGRTGTAELEDRSRELSKAKTVGWVSVSYLLDRRRMPMTWLRRVRPALFVLGVALAVGCLSGARRRATPTATGAAQDRQPRPGDGS